MARARFASDRRGPGGSLSHAAFSRIADLRNGGGYNGTNKLIWGT
jgi:hypothetical protein